MNPAATMMAWAITYGMTADDAERFAGAMSQTGNLDNATLARMFSEGLRIWTAARKKTHSLTFTEILGVEVSIESVTVLLPPECLAMFDLVFRAHPCNVLVTPPESEDVYQYWRDGEDLKSIERRDRGLRFVLDRSAVQTFCNGFFGNPFKVTLCR